MSLVESKNVETNKYELTVKVDAESFKEAVNKVYQKQKKNISIPGFRKGKAPRAMIEKMYGEEVFFEDAVNDLYPLAVSEAITESKLDVVARPDVEVTEVSKEAGVTYKVVVVVKPEVSLKAYKGLEVERKEEVITDEMIDARLASMQQRNARVIDVEDRAAQMGDTVVFDFEGFVDGEAFDGGKGEKFSLELGSGQFIPGFEEQIAGKTIGEEFDVNVTFPEDYHAEELKGKAAVFKCKLHEIKEKEMPALDDEFAKDVSEFDTLDELKADLKAKEEESAKKAADEAVENAVMEQLAGNLEAEIPEEMYEARVDSLMQDFEYRLQSQGLNMQMYTQYTGMDMDGFRKTFRAQAEAQVKVRLALEKVVELEALTVSDEDVDAEYEKLAASYNMKAEEIKPIVPAAELKQDMLMNKAAELVKASAVVTEKAE